MPQKTSMQQMLNQSLAGLPSQQYTPSIAQSGGASDLDILGGLGAMGEGSGTIPVYAKAPQVEMTPGAIENVQALVNPYGQSMMPQAAIPQAPQVGEIAAEPVREPAAIPERPTKEVEQAGMKAAFQGYEEGAKQVGKQKGIMDELQSMTQAFQEKQKANQEALQKAQLKAQEIEAESSKIQPQDFWANKSTGSKIAAAIAMGVGAYASAMTGGPNTAKQIIDQSIAQDLALQKEKYQRAKDRGALARSNYADLVNRLGSEEAADLTMMSNAYKMIDTKLKIQEANVNTQEKLASIQKLRADTQASYLQAQAKQVEALAKQELSKQVMAGGAVKPELLPYMDEKTLARYVDDPQFGGFARSPEAANKVSEALIDYNAGKTLIDTLKKINSQPLKSVDPKLIAQANIAASSLKGKLRGPVLGPGAVTEAEWKILNSMVSNPTDFFSLTAVNKAKLDALSNMFDNNMNSTAKAYNIKPKMAPTEANAVYVKTPDGRITKIAAQNLEEAKRRAKENNIKLEVIDVRP